jgi:DNA-binding NtrC family response regulator
VKQSTGYVWAYSEPGLGATFKVYLPRVHAETEAMEAQPRVEATVERGSETLLLVEDEASLRTLAADVLMRLGYTVLVAANGREALGMLDRHRGEVHLLVTDVVMPQMSGRQLAERVQLLHPRSRVLYMSATPTTRSCITACCSQGRRFCRSCVAPSALAKMVRTVLDRWKHLM